MDDSSSVRVSGDFNGDGRAEAVVLYQHTDGSIDVMTSLANASGGFGSFVTGYTVPAAAVWDWNAFRTIAGDFNGDGRSDLAVMYHHGDGSISMHTSLAGADGLLGAFGDSSMTVSAGAVWDWNAIRLP